MQKVEGIVGCALWLRPQICQNIIISICHLNVLRIAPLKTNPLGLTWAVSTTSLSACQCLTMSIAVHFFFLLFLFFLEVVVCLACCPCPLCFYTYISSTSDSTSNEVHSSGGNPFFFARWLCLVHHFTWICVDILQTTNGLRFQSSSVSCLLSVYITSDADISFNHD